MVLRTYDYKPLIYFGTAWIESGFGKFLVDHKFIGPELITVTGG